MRKKWSVIFISIFLSVIVFLGTVVYVFDPYFHFHKPYGWVSYSLGNYVYQNDGIAKNWDYNAIITGTSMTNGLSTELTDSLFGVDAVRMTFLGEGYRRINDNLRTAFENNSDIRLVIRAVDPIWFVTDADFLAYGSYDAYPTYLYDYDRSNDFQYLYNFGTLKNDLLPEVIRTVKGEPAATFDDNINYATGGIEKVKEKYVRAEFEEKTIEESETKEMMSALEKNIEVNLLSTIREHPDTQFIIFFPPYGTFIWDSVLRNGTGVFDRRFDMEKYVIEQLLQYDNVELFSFLDCFDITTDMNNYVDDLHYTDEVSDYIIKCMGSTKEHKITEDNYIEYLKRSHDYYLNYDYDSVFE